MQNDENNTSLELLYEGKDLLFTFKQDAIDFINRNNLKAELIEADILDEDHFAIDGYKSKLYWIAL